jgi:hypothetical protein
VSEVIAWDQETSGKTGIGNPVTYYESAQDLSMYFQPIVENDIRFEVEKQEQEMVNKPDISAVVTRHLCPFNQENIAYNEKQQAMPVLSK